MFESVMAPEDSPQPGGFDTASDAREHAEGGIEHGGSGPTGPSDAGFDVAGVGVVGLDGVVAELAGLVQLLWRVDSGQLSVVLSGLARVGAAVDAAAVAVTAEALSRGVIEGSRSAGVTAWVRSAAVGWDVGHCHAVAAVAQLGVTPGNAVVAEAVAAGSVSLRGAVVAVRETDRVMPVLPGGFDRGEVLGHFLTLGQQAGVREQRALARWLVGTYAGDTLAGQVIAQHEVETLSWRPEPSGMWSFTGVLAPDHAVVVVAALEGFSAPAPSVDPVTGVAVRDARCAGKRRADALVEVVAAGADRAVGVGVARGGSVRLVVTMGLAELTGRLGGVGRTGSGQFVDAGSVRRLACDADLVPVVLGGGSEVLDVGRTHRLATGAIRTAVALRDGGCTFPGCDRPPGWCRVHHVRAWCEGGVTSVANSALLCERHHTIVHRDQLSATITAHGVTWHEPTPLAA